jgi:hypothetical protein
MKFRALNQNLELPVHFLNVKHGYAQENGKDK